MDGLCFEVACICIFQTFETQSRKRRSKLKYRIVFSPHTQMQNAKCKMVLSENKNNRTKVQSVSCEVSEEARARCPLFFFFRSVCLLAFWFGVCGLCVYNNHTLFQQLVLNAEPLSARFFRPHPHPSQAAMWFPHNYTLRIRITGRDKRQPPPLSETLGGLGVPPPRPPPPPSSSSPPPRRVLRCVAFKWKA